MDLLADLGENPALELIAVLLLMAIWGGAILAVDTGCGRVICGPSVQAETPRGKPGRDDAYALSTRVLFLPWLGPSPTVPPFKPLR